MTRYAAPKLAAYAGLSAIGLLTALVFARPELVALTAPFLLALGAGLALATPPRVSVTVELEQPRALEGDEVTAHVRLAAASPVDRLDLYVRLPDGVELAAGRNPVALALVAGEERDLELKLRTVRWGGHVIGPAYLRARDPLGFLAWEATSESAPQLRTYPREDVLRPQLREPLRRRPKAEIRRVDGERAPAHFRKLPDAVGGADGRVRGYAGCASPRGRPAEAAQRKPWTAQPPSASTRRPVTTRRKKSLRFMAVTLWREPHSNIGAQDDSRVVLRDEI